MSSAPAGRRSTHRAHLAALVVILLAGALSATWAFVVPIFQAPDEPAHFDYAISIFSAGRLIRVSDGPTGWIVSPYTRYLMRASDYERIERHSSMHVRPGYGSRAYFAHLDAGAPRLNPPIAPDHRINYIVPLYPIGFYALEAVWMKVVSLFTPSLAAIFFAARLLCVVLMMIGLYFNYRTALNLGLPAWLGVALAAAVGFFPLTTFVSSYVQPDNLTYALVSASVFFASKLRTGEASYPTIAALGSSLGLLSITKYQFFVSVAIPTIFLAAVLLWKIRRNHFRVDVSVTALLVPSIALLCAQHWLVNAPNGAAGNATPSDIGFGYIRDVIAAGIWPAIAYVVRVSVGAFVDFFIIGPCAGTYWQVIGWFDTPIVIVNAHVASAVRMATSLVTVAVIAAVAFQYCRSALCVGRLFTQKHVLLGLDIMTRDPVLNSYVCFLAIMFVLYILTDNTFTAEGRHFYPYVFAGFLCFIYYAPRAAGKHAPHLSAICGCVLVGYALVAAAYAFADVRHRYYGPETNHYSYTYVSPAQMLGDPATGVLFPVETSQYTVIGKDTQFSFPAGARLQISGAAIFPKEGVPASHVAVVVDSRFAMPVLSNQYVLFVGELTRNVVYGYSGFQANVATAGFGEGIHSVNAYAQLPAGGRYERILPDRLFFLTEGKNGDFSPAFLRALTRAPLTPGGIGAITVCRGPSWYTRGLPVFREASRIVVAGVTRIPWDSRADRRVWLLLDGKPYPALYNKMEGRRKNPVERDGNAERTFFGTIPTQGLALGLHRVSAFAMPEQASQYARIGQPASFRVLRRQRPSPVTENSLYCADPLRQLAGK
jgi:hypothetical protein